MRAVGTLAEDPQWKDRLTTEIVDMKSEKGQASEALYEWGGEGHGLVVLDEAGKAVVVLKGHAWGSGQDAKALAVMKERLKALD